MTATYFLTRTAVADAPLTVEYWDLSCVRHVAFFAPEQPGQPPAAEVLVTRPVAPDEGATVLAPVRVRIEGQAAVGALRAALAGQTIATT